MLHGMGWPAWSTRHKISSSHPGSRICTPSCPVTPGKIRRSSTSCNYGRKRSSDKSAEAGDIDPSDTTTTVSRGQSTGEMVMVEELSESQLLRQNKVWLQEQLSLRGVEVDSKWLKADLVHMLRDLTSSTTSPDSAAHGTQEAERSNATTHGVTSAQGDAPSSSIGVPTDNSPPDNPDGEGGVVKSGRGYRRRHVDDPELANLASEAQRAVLQQRAESARQDEEEYQTRRRSRVKHELEGKVVASTGRLEEDLMEEASVGLDWTPHGNKQAPPKDFYITTIDEESGGFTVVEPPKEYPDDIGREIYEDRPVSIDEDDDISEDELDEDEEVAVRDLQKELTQEEYMESLREDYPELDDKYHIFDYREDVDDFDRQVEEELEDPGEYPDVTDLGYEVLPPELLDQAYGGLELDVVSFGGPDLQEGQQQVDLIKAKILASKLRRRQMEAKKVQGPELQDQADQREGRVEPLLVDTTSYQEVDARKVHPMIAAALAARRPAEEDVSWQPARSSRPESHDGDKSASAEPVADSVDEDFRVKPEKGEMLKVAASLNAVGSDEAGAHSQMDGGGSPVATFASSYSTISGSTEDKENATGSSSLVTPTTVGVSSFSGYEERGPGVVGQSRFASGTHQMDLHRVYQENHVPAKLPDFEVEDYPGSSLEVEETLFLDEAALKVGKMHSPEEEDEEARRVHITAKARTLLPDHRLAEALLVPSKGSDQPSSDEELTTDDEDEQSDLVLGSRADGEHLPAHKEGPPAQQGDADSRRSPVGWLGETEVDPEQAYQDPAEDSFPVGHSHFSDDDSMESSYIGRSDDMSFSVEEVHRQVSAERNAGISEDMDYYCGTMPYQDLAGPAGPGSQGATTSTQQQLVDSVATRSSSGSPKPDQERGQIGSQADVLTPPVEQVANRQTEKDQLQTAASSTYISGTVDAAMEKMGIAGIEASDGAVGAIHEAEQHRSSADVLEVNGIGPTPGKPESSTSPQGADGSEVLSIGALESEPGPTPTTEEEHDDQAYLDPVQAAVFPEGELLGSQASAKEVSMSTLTPTSKGSLKVEDDQGKEDDTSQRGAAKNREPPADVAMDHLRNFGKMLKGWLGMS